MRKYEVMVILDPELEEKTVNPSLETFLNVVRQDGGQVNKVDIWGRRRLAFEINKKTEGIYAILDITSSAFAVSELDELRELIPAYLLMRFYADLSSHRKTVDQREWDRPLEKTTEFLRLNFSLGQ